MNALKIDHELALPNLDIAQYQFDLTIAQQEAEAIQAQRKERHKDQRRLRDEGIIRFQHLAHEAAKQDLTKDIGGNISFDRDCVSDWVRVKDDDPRLAIEVRASQRCSKSSLDKPISVSYKPRFVEIEAHIVDKETGHELKPETIYRTEGYRVDQTVDDIRGQIEIVPGMDEWEEFNDLLGKLEDHFGVKPIDPKPLLRH